MGGWDMNKKTRRILFVLGGAALIALAVFVVISIVRCSGIKKFGERNLAAVKEYLVDYTDVDHGSISREYKPADTGRYIVIRNNKDGWSLSELTKGLSVNKAWKEKDVKDVEAVIVVLSSYKSKSYTMYQNGRAVGEAVISSESVEILFYNPRERCLFAREVIRGKSLPDKTERSDDYTISNGEIRQVINKALNDDAAEKEKPKAPEWVPPLMALVVFPGAIFLIVFLIKRAKRKKKNAAGEGGGA